MVTVGIVGLLGTLALPWYRTSIHRAHRTEAYLGLEGLNTAQHVYRANYDQYTTNFNALPDFRISGGLILSADTYKGRKYTYTLTQPWGANSFYCTATAELDGDGWPDMLAAWETDLQ